VSTEPRDLIILRIAEIFLKGRNRNVFFKRFVRNARRLLEGLDGVRVESMYLRAVVYHPRELRDECIARLRRLFGLASMSPATAVDRSMDAFAAEAIRQAKLLPAGTTFKVDTNRRDKSFEPGSPTVSGEIGGRIVQAVGLPVDVHDPQHMIHVEIDREGCYVYSAVVPGPGGLPVGTAGNVSVLLSGGIDSPVATWSAMRRGCVVNAIYFHSFPYTGDKTKEKVLDIARKLALWQGRLTVHVVHFTDVQKQLREHGRAENAVLLYRRMMMRAASIIAERGRCQALVTGENLGQVASQTLHNLRVIEDAASLPVLRPLITYDKAEIIDRARAIDTFELSILPYDDCCSLFVPKHPATRARIADLVADEDGLDIDAMATALADNVERHVIDPGKTA